MSILTDEKIIKKGELTEALQFVFPNETIKEFSRERAGVANEVYKVVTDSNKLFIVKRYTNKINFELSNMLYDLYEQNGVSVIRRINVSSIVVNNHCYNVFNYVAKDDNLVIDSDFLLTLLFADRKVDLDENLTQKYDYYFAELKGVSNVNGIDISDVQTVVKIYEEIRSSHIFDESYLNHGDISKGNLIQSNNILHIIDFDETLVSTFLYDFAVIMIKLFVKDYMVEKKWYDFFKDEIQKHYSYNDDDFSTSVKLYLCKILLQKFYLHHIGEIDLFSARHQTDNYKIYINILRNFCRGDFYV